MSWASGSTKGLFAYVQLWVPCKLGVRLCHLKLPGISNYVCRGAYAFCLATQARCGRPSSSCCDSVLTVEKRHQIFVPAASASSKIFAFSCPRACVPWVPPFARGIALTMGQLVRAQYDDIQAMGGHFNYFDVRKKVTHTATGDTRCLARACHQCSALTW